MNFKLFLQNSISGIMCLLCLSCNSSDDNSSIASNLTYTTQNEIILKNAEPIILKGVNALNVFGIDDSALMQEWNINIVREFIGNLREQPIEGNAILDSKNQWLHPLQKIVDIHRQNGRITIICPFGWVDQNGEQTLFTGLNPSEQDFYLAYLKKMEEIANHFKGQRDVWIEVWNEPYAYHNGNGYSSNLWLSDQIEMIQNLRTSGFDNIILVSGNAQGQSEKAILEFGKTITSTYNNIVFDLHAYESWLIDSDDEIIRNRITNLKSKGLPVLFGEIGVINSTGLMQPQPFLKVAKELNIPTLAWVWKRDQGDQNALLTDQNTPNDFNNNNWGSTYFNFLKD